MLRNYTKEDYDKGLKPTQLSNGIKIRLCEWFEGNRWFIVVDENATIYYRYRDGESAIEGAPNLQIEVPDDIVEYYVTEFGAGVSSSFSNYDAAEAWPFRNGKIILKLTYNRTTGEGTIKRI